MNHIGSDAPDVKIIPPLVYLAGIVIGLLATIWMPSQGQFPVRQHGLWVAYSCLAVPF